MKIWLLVLAVVAVSRSSLAEPNNSRSSLLFLGRHYEITRLASVKDGRTGARAYIFAPAPAVRSVMFDTEIRRMLDGGERAPDAGYVWQVEAAEQLVAIGDGTLLFIERVEDRWLVCVFSVGDADLTDEDIASVVERYRSKMAHAAKEEPNQTHQHNAGDRPPMNDLPASDIPSSPAPRG